MITILPCYSLEDFSIYRTAKDADQIFSAWTALYHPALIRHFGSLPSWDRASTPSPGKKHDLILIPPCAMGQVPRDWLRRAEEGGSVIISDKKTRAEMTRAALEALELDPTDAPDDVETFYALGYSYFVSELFSRKLRYMSNLDTQGFRENGLAAARALDEGNRPEYEKRVRRAFGLLTEAKEYFFPKAMNLLDLTVASRESLAALGETLRRRAVRDESTNLLISTRHLELLRDGFPDILTLLKGEIGAGRVTLVGGDLNESPLGLLSPAETAERLLLGWEKYYEIVGAVPHVFGRCEAGYSPILPQILNLAGCKNALLFTDDGWKGTDQVQSRVDWTAPGGAKVGCLSRPAYDGGSAKDYMLLPDRVGYSSSGDRALSAIYKHRPGKESIWFGDMARMTKFAPVLGEVIPLAEFFKKTDETGVRLSLEKDAFRTNFLTRAARDGRRNPVSVWPVLRELSARMNRTAALALFAGLLHERRSIRALDRFDRLVEDAAPLDELKDDLTEQISFPWRLTLEGFEDGEEKTRAEEPLRREESLRLERIARAERVMADAQAVAREFARLLAGSPAPGEGVLLLNMAPTPVTYEADGAYTPSPATDMYIRTIAAPGYRRVTVTVPPYSILALQKTAPPAPPPLEPAPKKRFFSRLAEKIRGGEETNPNRMVELETVRFKDGATERFYTVRTNYFVMKIDADTGEVRSVRTRITAQITGRRGLLNQPGMGNRIAWQAVMKLSGKRLKEDHRSELAGGYGYSIMTAEKIEVISEGPFEAVLEITGALVAPSGERLSGYRQRIAARRSSRVIGVELEFIPDALPQDAPWDEYYGLRLAWNDNLAELRPACHGLFWETTRDFFQAPDLLDIRSEDELGISILGDGLPFYRRVGARGADAVLLPRGEEGRVFRFAVGVDLPDPLAEASRRAAPEPIVLENVAVDEPRLTRFLNVSPESAAVIDLKPVYETASDGAESERLTGFRLLLQETRRKKTAVTITSRLPIRAAVPVNLFDQPTGEPYELVDPHILRAELAAGAILAVRLDVDFDAVAAEK
ncbi:MAG: hypothetical protein J6S40_03325 [Thermoguttaceae bacterium]|nr:hypothetical protein [Thermoguttaceae bacterium]